MDFFKQIVFPALKVFILVAILFAVVLFGGAFLVSENLMPMTESGADHHVTALDWDIAVFIF